MQTWVVPDAQADFDALIERAQSEPVRMMQGNRVLGVLVSEREFEAARAFHVRRLQLRLAQAASAANLLPEQVDALLADER